MPKKTANKPPKQQKHAGGRPPKYRDPDVLARLTEALQKGACYKDAACHADITYESFNNWMKKGEQAKSGEFFQFFQAIKKAKTAAKLKWLDKIEAAAEDGSWQAAAWKLERTDPEEYGRRAPQRIEHSGPNGGPIEQHHTGSIALDDLQKLDATSPTRIDAWKQQRGFAGRGKERLGV